VYKVFIKSFVKDGNKTKFEAVFEPIKKLELLLLPLALNINV